MVLKGARKLYQYAPPKCPLLETNDTHTRLDQAAFADLSQYGYHYFQIPNRMISVTLQPVSVRTAPGFHDCLAVHPNFVSDFQRIFKRHIAPLAE